MAHTKIEKLKLVNFGPYGGADYVHFALRITMSFLLTCGLGWFVDKSLKDYTTPLRLAIVQGLLLTTSFIALTIAFWVLGIPKPAARQYIKAIAETLPDSELKFIDLSCNGLGDADALVLAQSLKKNAIDLLKLCGNEITAHGVRR